MQKSQEQEIGKIEKLDHKVVSVDSNGRVRLPKKYSDGLGIELGDMIMMYLKKKGEDVNLSSDEQAIIIKAGRWVPKD